MSSFSPRSEVVFVPKIYDEYDIFRPVTGSEISHNVRVKVFPDGSKDVLFCAKNIFRESGFECVEPARHKPAAAPSVKRVGSAAPSSRSIRRAKAAIRDIALCNDFSHFVTLTVSPDMADRYSIDDIYKRLKVFLSNAVQRYGLKYIVIPEHHKDGAIHFHGLINNALDLVSSGTFIVPGHKKPIRFRSEKQRLSWVASGYTEVFNISEWRLGFSTAIPLYGDKAATIAYVCKYIDKQMSCGKIGGRFYYSGGDLHRPFIFLDDGDYPALVDRYGAAFEFTIDEASLTFALWQNVR